MTRQQANHESFSPSVGLPKTSKVVFWFAFVLTSVPYALFAASVVRGHLHEVTFPDPLGSVIIDICLYWIPIGGGIAILLVLCDWVLSIWKNKQRVFSWVACRSMLVTLMAVLAFPALYVGAYVFRYPVRNVHDAIRLRRTERLEQYLREQPTLVHQRFENGGTLLHSDHLDTFGASVLISHGAEVNARDECGRTPLHIALSRDHVTLTHRLVSLGANVNARDNEGNAPLHVAAKSCPTSVAYLLKSGAVPDVKNDEGLTPLAIAREQRRLASGQLRQDITNAVQSLEKDVKEE